MAIKYKLTDCNMRTHRNTQWALREEKSTNGKGPLCTSGWLHCYSHPVLAVIFNAVHAQFNPITMRLFKCKTTGNHTYNRGLKEGCTTMELIEELPLPQITNIQLVVFSFLCYAEIMKHYDSTFDSRLQSILKSLSYTDPLYNYDILNNDSITRVLRTFSKLGKRISHILIYYLRNNVNLCRLEVSVLVSIITKSYNLDLIKLINEAMKY